MKLTSLDIELAVVQEFNCRTKLIVPNVSWGMGFAHELDLLILTQAGYGWEVEIKISKQDLLRDKQKKHGHRSLKIKFLYFALPDYLLDFKDTIPERAGILSIESEPGEGYSRRCETIRNPEANSKYKFTEEEQLKLAMLGAMRIWGLKKQVRSALDMAFAGTGRS